MLSLPENLDGFDTDWFDELKRSEIGEIDWLDFKLKDTENIGSCVTSFLNKETGGVILYGMEKKDKDLVFEDVRNPQKVIDEKISKRLQHITDPAVDDVHFRTVEYEGHNVIIMLVKSGRNFPYFYNGIIYLRSGSDSYPIDDKRQIMALLSHTMSLEKSLRILRNEIELLKKGADDIAVMNKRLKELSIKNSGSVTAAFDKLVPPLDDSRLKDVFLIVEPYLSENNLIDDYFHILKRIRQVNQRVNVLEKGISRFSQYSNFENLARRLVKRLESFEKRLKS